MNCKKFAHLLIVTFLAVLLAGCSQSASGNGSADNGKETSSLPDATSSEFKQVDYKFRVSNLPYDSTGLKIYAQVESSKYKVHRVLLGEITSTAKDVYLTATVKLPEEYDALYLCFTDSNNKMYYYNRVRKEYYYNEEKDLWDVDGYYYYYYKDKRDLTAPYAAISENSLKNLEWGKTYEFDADEGPYLVFQADNTKDKKLHFSIDGDTSKVALYVSSDKTKFMTYKGDRTLTEFYDGTTETLYIMVRPIEYDFSEDAVKPKCSITITDLASELENCIKIDKACFASDGKIYATGTTADNSEKNTLYCIAPDNYLSKTTIKNFVEPVYTIGELEEGVVYVSYKDCISKVDIATGTVTDLVKDLGIKATNVVMFKSDYLVVIGAELHTTTEHGYLVNKRTGAYTEMECKKYPYILSLVKNLQYISDKDLFIYERNGSPKDISFLRIDITDPSNPKYVSWDSCYHVECKFDYPTTLFSTSPLKILTAAGEIFNIDVDVINNNDPNDDGYRDAIDNWCTYEDVLCKSYSNCYILGDYIYYLNYDSSGKNCTIEKCALTAPKTVLAQKTYETQKAVDFYKSGEKLYLLTNSAKSIYTGDYYKVYLHTIDF